MNLRKNCPKSIFASLGLALFCLLESWSLLAGPGSLDTTFNVIANNTVYATVVQPNGRILIGGAFSTVAGASRNGFARLFPDGTLDTSITNSIPTGGATVYAILIQPDGKFVLGGSFSFSFPSSHQNIVRLNTDGSIDGTFTNSAPNSSIYALAIQADGKILMGGQFNTVGNTSHYFIARLNTDGTVDNTFNPGNISGSAVNAVAVQNDGNILIGGSFNNFTTYGLTRNNIARLTTNGTPDLSYQPSASSSVQAIYMEPSGKSVWVGSFSTLNNFTRQHVGRLNADGSLDSGFTATSGVNGTVYAVTEDLNDDIYQGGQFNEYGIVTHEGVARVFSDGTIDNSYNNTNFVTPLVRCLALQSDGKAIVGGNFFTWATSGRTNLVRLYGNNYPAEIITQPKSINVAVGTNVTFFTDVSNPTQVDYQWRYDGQDILGATDNEYSIFNAQLADAGTYSVFVNSGVGGTTSSNAVLQVGIPPAITQQPTPTSLAVTQGQTATFTAAASGTPLNYYWLLNGKSLAGTNATLTVTNVLPNQAGNYTLVASNFLGTATSAPAALSVLYPNNIVNGPSSQSVAVGGKALFTVSASGNPLNYQWLKSGSPIPGATGSSFQITNVMFSDAASYSVTVSNQFNSQTSSVATLSVGYPPSITLQPTNVTANLGDTVSFTSAASGTGPLSYQWLFNNNPIANQTASNLTLTNVQIGNIGNYALSVSSPFGSAISSNAFLNLNGYPSNLYFGLIAYYPFSGNANDATGNGNNGTVSGAALTQDRFGNPGMAYQFDGVSNYIYCSIVNIPAGSAPRALSLWAQSDATNTAGANPAWWGSQQSLQGFGIEAYGTPYLWAGQLDGGVDVVYSDAVVDTNWHQLVLTYDGATLAIAVDGVQQNNLGVTANTSISGLYIGSGLAANYFPGAVDEVRIYNRALSTNDVAQLYQLESGLPLIQQQPQSLSLVVGQTANFNVQVASIGSLSYQWYYSNAPLANATNALLTIPSVQMTNAGAYFVVVSNTLGSATSGVANLTVGTPPQMALVHFGPNNLPMIQMSGTSGFNYMVQTTTNLTPPIVWQTIATIPADTNGNWTFIDTNPPSLGSRFYRVAAP